MPSIGGYLWSIQKKKKKIPTLKWREEAEDVRYSVPHAKEFVNAYNGWNNAPLGWTDANASPDRHCII